jgi:hypothetical protein
MSDALPAAVARVVEVMRGFPAEWCLCGGWGVDAWLGRETREHKDVDIAVFHNEVDAVYEHFDGWQLWAHDENGDDSERQWDRRQLVLPAHIHAHSDGIDLDIQVTARDAGSWVVHGDPLVTLEVECAVQSTSWGLRTLAPEVILFYKALDGRPHDIADRDLLLPHLSERQARWLRDAVAQVR